MVSVTISIGSNCGDRKRNVEEALQWLKRNLIQFRYSDIYESPCAKSLGNPYMNAVAAGVFQGTGIELEEMLKDKEHEMGRTKECRERGDVPIDMDIVIMDGGVTKPWDYRQKFFQTGFSQIS